MTRVTGQDAQPDESVHLYYVGNIRNSKIIIKYSFKHWNTYYFIYTSLFSMVYIFIVYNLLIDKYLWFKQSSLISNLFIILSAI